MNIDIKVSPVNLLGDWGYMESWSAGDSAAPDGWALEGASAAVAKESTIKKFGSYSAKVTRNGTNTYIYITIHEKRGISYWRGKTIVLGVWVYATAAATTRIRISDGITSVDSSHHSGNSEWEFLTVKMIVDESATQIKPCLMILNSDTSSYFDGAIACEGESLLTQLTNTNLNAIHAEGYRADNVFSVADFQAPNKEGSQIQEAKLKDRIYTVSGSVVGATAEAARTNYDSLAKALYDGPKDLYLYDTRLIRGYLYGLTEEDPHKKSLRHIPYSFRFKVDGLPFMRYCAMLRHQEAISSSPTSFNFTYDGNVVTLPKITFVAGGTDITSLTLQNLTTGETFSFTGTVSAGDSLVIDTDAKTVLNDDVDALADFSNGDFTKIIPGTNYWKFTGSDCTIYIDYYERFL